MKFLLLLIALTMFPARGTDKKTTGGDKNEGNWVTFHINPENAIVTVDSVSVHSVRNGFLQLMVPFGKHSFICESPFYRKMSDCFEVSDSTKTSVNVNLVPEFAYLVVHNPVPDADIYIDGQKAGSSKAESGRLDEGRHRITIVKYGYCWYDDTVNLATGEKRSIMIDSACLAPVPIENISGVVLPGLTGPDSAEEVMERMKIESGGISVHTDTPGAVILVNGLEAGIAPAIIKNLPSGIKYRITVRKGGFKDASRYVEIRKGTVVDLELKMKKL